MVVLTAVDQGHARDLPELMETVEVGELLMPAGCQERKTNADLLPSCTSVRRRR
ncbi:MAG: hypothetical protein ACLSGI_08640 [Butyricicoccaceae bacterium]